MLIVLGMWTFLIVYPAWSLGKLQEATRHMAREAPGKAGPPPISTAPSAQIAQDPERPGSRSQLGRGAAAEV